MKWRNKSLLILCLGLSFAALLFFQMGLFVLNHIFGTFIQFNLFQLCVSLFKGNEWLYQFVLFIINSFIAWTVFTFGKKIIQQLVVQNRVWRKMNSLKDEDLTQRINLLFNRKSHDICVIDYHESIAFTIGFFKPSIVLSTNLIRILSETELEAVIQHETAHQKYFDPLKVFCLQAISEVMWYIPLTKWTFDNYKIMIELVADEHAVHKMGSDVGLSSALVKLIKSSLKEYPSANALVPFSDGTVNYRIKQLLDPEFSVPVKCRKATVFISISMIVLIMMLMILV